MRRTFLATLIASVCSLGLLTSAALAQPKVLVTIKPLHSLAAGVMGDLGTPSLLIEGAASPHTYSLRPSEALMLAEADLVVWIGPTLERFMQRPLEALAEDAETLRADSARGVEILPARSGGSWEAHDHLHDPGHDHGHEHGDGQEDAEEAGNSRRMDPHLWLDPDNAVAIVRALGEKLAALDPGNAAGYRANVKDYEARLKALDDALRARLAPVADSPYVVFHDAYQYFERHYGLHPVGAISVSPGRSPGARRVLEIQQRIKATGAQCIFAEPQFPPALVERLASDTGIRAAVLDPVGADLEAGPDAYPRLLDELANAVVSCLSERD